MTKQDLINFVLEHGSSSQKYIVRRDILDEEISTSEMIELQAEIVAKKHIQKKLKQQNSDGWFGIELHGGNGIDGIVNYLIDSGVEPGQPFMRKAKEALLLNLDPDERRDRHRYPVNRNWPFSKIMTLGLLHVKGEEPEQELVEVYNRMIKVFEDVLNVKSLDEVSRTTKVKKYQGCRLGLKDKLFPWPSEFILLSCSGVWKNEGSLKTIEDGLNHIAAFMPIPIIFDPAENHYLGPIGTYLEYELDDCTGYKPNVFANWFIAYLRLVKICDIRKVPYFYRPIKTLLDDIKNDTFISKLSDEQKNTVYEWFNYGMSQMPLTTSLSKTMTITETDILTCIYFRVLLILHYSNLQF
ncbi:MAG: hypothetical protein K0S55_1325 [Clostridia bacterium]|nr:hypothetical protein [Clostridia bacterium]